MNADRHRAVSRAYMAMSATLAQGDDDCVALAAEAAWGAYGHAVDAARHRRHRPNHIGSSVAQSAEFIAELDASGLLIEGAIEIADSASSVLHNYFYARRHDIEDVHAALIDVGGLIDQLLALDIGGRSG